MQAIQLISCVQCIPLLLLGVSAVQNKADMLMSRVGQLIPFSATVQCNISRMTANYSYRGCLQSNATTACCLQLQLPDKDCISAF